MLVVVRMLVIYILTLLYFVYCSTIASIYSMCVML
jgi:hypothetical protein